MSCDVASDKPPRNCSAATTKATCSAHGRAMLTVYAGLRRLMGGFLRAAPGDSLQPTAAIDEAYRVGSMPMRKISGGPWRAQTGQQARRWIASGIQVESAYEVHQRGRGIPPSHADHSNVARHRGGSQHCWTA